MYELLETKRGKVVRRWKVKPDNYDGPVPARWKKNSNGTVILTAGERVKVAQ